jgi:hypothetical protein
MIYKCTACGKTGYSENGFRCGNCGAGTVGIVTKKTFKWPEINFKRIAYILGVSLLFIFLYTFVALGFCFN